MAVSLDELAACWNCPALTRAIVESSPRLRTSLGRAYPRLRLVRLHARLDGDLAHLRDEILVHEAAHIAAAILHGPRIRPHGPEWRALVLAAGYAPHATHRAPLPVRRRRRRSYRHYCRVCGYRYFARTTNRRWRCPVCIQAGYSGRLEVLP
jgi:predicted SprT family Zn-dependent metalloprotease